MGYDISTSEIQYDAADKKMDKNNAEGTLESTILQNVD